MTKYVVFYNRKKTEETIKEYIENTVIGVVEAKNASVALKNGAQQYKVEQYKVDVVALSRASIFQQDYINKTGAWKPKKKGGK